MTSRVHPVSGVSIGHWTDAEARTGCTVLLFNRSVPAAAEVRGGAPGTRELDALGYGRIGRRADAILFTGGSAFGLAAADGVMRFLRERDRGFPTAAGPVPIVPAAVIYDLANGRPVAPDASAGYAACRAATLLPEARFGRVGAGTGARFGSVNGAASIQDGGIGAGQQRSGPGTVTAIVVLNAFGIVRDETAKMSTDPRPAFVTGARPTSQFSAFQRDNTTLVAVVVDAPCGHRTLQNLCVAAHDALARRILPTHTEVDGDVAFAVALHETSVDTSTLTDRLQLAMAVELAVERAVLDASQLPHAL